MSSRTLVVVALALALVAVVAYDVGQRTVVTSVDAAQDEPQTWNSTMVWRPTLEEAGVALAEVVNQIDARCQVDVDPVTATNGETPEGTVYAFAITWTC
jgi:hypothetical protein